VAKRKTHDTTASGKPITDKLVKELADKAEAGYDVEETIRRRGGRPRSGPPPASTPAARAAPLQLWKTEGWDSNPRGT